MLSKKEKKQLIKIKELSFKLYKSYQIPHLLYISIMKLNNDSDIKYINKLKDLTTHYLRIKGYYQKYPLDKDAEQLLRSLIN